MVYIDVVRLEDDCKKKYGGEKLGSNGQPRKKNLMNEGCDYYAE